MAISLTLGQVRTIEQNNTYKVVTSVTAASGIPAEVFVFNTSSQTYSHVASTFDMVTYPDAANINQGVAFYRASSATLTSTNVEEAADVASQLKTLVADLVTAYAAEVVGFVGTSSNTYTA